MQTVDLSCTKINKNEGVPIFLVEMDNFDLVEGDDVHDPTTTIQG